nr:MAG TPA: hypothetical protein [Caudoviricetes sp.]
MKKVRKKNGNKELFRKYRIHLLQKNSLIRIYRDYRIIIIMNGKI